MNRVTNVPSSNGGSAHLDSVRDFVFLLVRFEVSQAKPRQDVLGLLAEAAHGVSVVWARCIRFIKQPLVIFFSATRLWF